MKKLPSETELYQALWAYQSRDITPMHMPGHKRRALCAPDLPWHLDISEIDGFDNLHAPEGILREAASRAAALWGSDEACFLVNGSSGGILAGIYAAVQPGDWVLIARNCHKSVYHAIELLGLRPVYLNPPVIEGTELCGSIEAAAVEQALRQYPAIRLAVITSPTYEGVLSDVAAIAEILHREGIPLLVDEAHGAHLGLSPHFPESAVSQEADLVVQSLHKGLPSLTQTAILHRREGLISPGELRHALAVFQTTSPSYPFMASIDSCVTFIRAEKELLFSAWKARLETIYQTAQSFVHLSLLTRERDPQHIHAHDPGKLTILCGGTTYTGDGLLKTLREEFKIEMEMALSSYVLAMSSPASTEEDFSRLKAALCALEKAAHPAPLRAFLPMPPMPEAVMPIGKARRAAGRQMPLSESVGQIAKTYIWAYPPGVPLITPGQRITAELAACLREFAERGIVLKSSFDAGPGRITTVAAKEETLY